jgi:predicted transcriptional regulator of viral defense system
MSVIVNSKVSPLERTRKILEDQRGTLFTSDLAKFNIPRTYLATLEQNGEIKRVSRGVYQALNTLEDEWYSFQAIYSSSIYSHETALYLLDLTDRTPLRYSVSVPVGYHTISLNKSGHKIFYVNRKLFGLGVITLKSPHGNPIRVTGMERTICDILRSRNQMDMQIVYETLKCYVKRTEKDIDLLYAYAKRFRVQKIIREYVEILL